MRGLLKFTLFSLITLTSLNAGYFDGKSIQYFRDAITRSFPPADSEKKEASFISSRYLRIGDDIYSATLTDTVGFNTALKSGSGFFFQKKGDTYTSLYHYDSSYESADLSCQGNTCQLNDFYQKFPQAYKKVTFSYYNSYSLSKVATCPSDQNFNSNTGQCQKCNENESWDPETNTCFNDCRKDGKINKFAFTDGSCIDCSGEKDSLSVLQCICRGYGNSSIDPKIWGKNGGSPDGCHLEGSCGDGSIQHSFTNPNCKPDDNPDPKPDDNKTKPDTPKPDNNKTKPDDPKPDDPTTPGTGDKGKDGKKDGKGSKDDAKGDNNTTIINNNNNSKDGDAKFNKGDFDDGDLEKERDGLYGDISKHIGEGLSKFDGIRDGIDQFVNNVQLKGFEKVKPSIKAKCPIKKQISLPNGKSKDIIVDYCENLSPVSEISYYAFYVGFAVGGFILFLKLLIFSI